MWRRRKSSDGAKRQTETTDYAKDNEVCPKCIQLMQENSQLKEELAILKGEGKRKQYTINPTLYTFYKNNVQKNRISRYAELIKIIYIQSSQPGHGKSVGC